MKSIEAIKEYGEQVEANALLLQLEYLKKYRAIFQTDSETYKHCTITIDFLTKHFSPNNN